MGKELIINAENLPLGRIAAFVVKQALLGNKIIIANCDKAIISGSKKNIVADYKQRRARGTPEEGPFFPKTIEGIVKRAVRGMLHYKKGRGREAFRRVRYVKGPLNGMANIVLKKGKLMKYITEGALSRLM